MKRRRLTQMDCVEIRAARKAAREFTLKKLAQKYGVSPSMIHSVAVGRRGA